jgi:hypothetical protein
MEEAMNAKSYLLVTLTVALCLFPAGISALDYNNITCIHQYYHNWQDGVYDVKIRGDYAYLACGDEGMRIIDISNPEAYQDVGQVIYGDVQVLAIDGNLAFLGSTWDGVPIVDISNPESPREISIVQFEGLKQAIRIKDNYAFMCSNWGALIIVDISDPASPQIVWDSLGTRTANDIDIHGNIAYVATSYFGLLVMDISNPASPQVLSSYVTGDNQSINGVAVSGNYAYLAAGWNGLEVVDLATMQLVAAIDSLSYAFRVKTADNHAYISYGDPDCPLAIVDISNPLSPQTTGIYFPPQDLVNFDVVGDLIYVADWQHCLRVLDISDPCSPYETYVYNRYGQDLDVVVFGDYAYVHEDCKLKIIDVSDMKHPLEVGYYELGWSTSNLKIAGDVGLIARSENPCLIAIDLADPDPPNVLGTFSVESYYGRNIMAVYDHYVYQAYGSGFKIIDVSDPSNMQDVGFFSEPSGVRSIEVHGTYAIYQNYNRYLKAIDLSNPLAPEVVASYRLSDYLRDMKCVDGRFYVITFDELFIFDITSFDQWSPLAMVEPFTDSRDMSGIDIRGRFLYVTDFQHGLNVFDLTNIGFPQLVGDIATPGSATGICLKGDTAIVADITNLGFYDCSPVITDIETPGAVVPQSFVLLPNYPNPFNSSTNIQFELPAPVHLTLAVFDMLGRNVLTIADGEFEAGRHTIRWDGTGSAGAPVASGRYYLKAKADEETRSVPMLLLK